MARSKLDVENIGWSEQIKDNILVSGSIIVTGSLKISGLGSDSSVILVGPDNDITASDTLYIDEVNTRVGMGISTPQEDFHIHGNDATLRLGNGLNSGEHSPKLQFSELANSDGAMTYGMSIEYNGAQNRLELKRHANNESGQTVMTFPRNTSEVGIATPGNPEATLHVYGGNSGETFSNVDGIAIENAGSSPTFYAFQVATAGAGKSFTITNAGTVGIGTTSPSSELDVAGDLNVSGNLSLTGALEMSYLDIGPSGSNGAKLFSNQEMYVGANNNLSYTIQTNGNIQFENAVTSSHFKVEGTGGQFVAHNEDTVKLKHVNWYSSNDRQYGQGQLWYQQWFGALEPSDLGAQGGRRIGFFFHKPNKGASDADGGTSAHPTNTHMYLDRTGMFLQTGSFIVEAGNLQITGSDGSSGAASFEDYVIAELSIPGLDLQTDTNAFRFNCPYGLTVEGLDLYLDQHTTSGNVTVTVTNTTDAEQMISLSVTGTNTSASTTTVTSGSCDSGDVITFAITATPANAQGLRANMRFRRNL